MNADDICAELAAARAYITRGDYTAALEAIDQAVKVWAAERDYWALIQVENERWLTEALKFEDWNARVDAENEAVALRAEVEELRALLVRATTESENARIRAFSHNQQVRWVGRDGD